MGKSPPKKYSEKLCLEESFIRFAVYYACFYFCQLKKYQRASNESSFISCLDTTRLNYLSVNYFRTTSPSSFVCKLCWHGYQHITPSVLILYFFKAINSFSNTSPIKAQNYRAWCISFWA